MTGHGQALWLRAARVKLQGFDLANGHPPPWNQLPKEPMLPAIAVVAELVDAADLKSADPKGS